MPWRFIGVCSLLLGLTWSSLPAPSDVITNSSSLMLSETGINRVRQGKAWLPFYVVVRFGNVECQGTNNLLGTCYLSRECRQQAGTVAGSCARRIGRCCVVTRTCGGPVSRSNNTYYRNPGFPNTTTTGTRCKISIAKLRSSICQIKITFTTLQLAQPDSNGTCVTDYLLITGTDYTIPRICGSNDGQHLYLRFMNDSSPIQLTIVTNPTVNFARKWDILVSQLNCSIAAPLGCLQYYIGLSGTVSSFNFGTKRGSLTRQLANLRYGICIRPEAGYCGTEWNQASLTSFTVSDNTTLVEQNNLLGDLKSQGTGSNCTSDFIIIPNALQNMVPTNSDRFCGNALLPTRSMTPPMLLTVVNNDVESGYDDGNSGFQLNYRQITC